MGVPTMTLLTFEEFERLPDRPGKSELLKGELIELPPAERRHNIIAHWIFVALLDALRQDQAAGDLSDLESVYHEMGYRLAPRTWLQPDVSITHRTQTPGQYYEGAPALAVEIISPSNTAEEMQSKVALYFEHGAREVWLVFPTLRTIVVHTPNGHSRNVSDTLTTTLLPGISLSVAEMLHD
jgi:Uma2 family endonuclease